MKPQRPIDTTPLYRPSRFGEIFHNIQVDELLGAGSAGPGKTTILRWDPFTQILIEHERCRRASDHEFPLEWGASTGWCLYLRRQFKDLGQFVNRSKQAFEQVDPGVKFVKDSVEMNLGFVFSCGYHYQLGHCNDPDDWEQYQGGEYCVAKGTGIEMGDGTSKPIEDVLVGDMVMTLEGPRRVTATHRTGMKPCIEMNVWQQGVLAGTQVHPTTHPVLLAASGDSADGESRNKDRAVGRRTKGCGVWNDYESLLFGRPESPVRRVSAIDARIDCVGSGGSPRVDQQLPRLFVPVVLHAPTLRKAMRRLRSSTESSARQESLESSVRSPEDCWRDPSSTPSGLPRSSARSQQTLDSSDGCPVCGSACVTPDRQTPGDSPGGCSFCSRPRGGQPPSESVADAGCVRRLGDAAGHSPTGSAFDALGETHRDSPRTSPLYPHFYTGEGRQCSEEIRFGTAELRWYGLTETFDLTVECANHYITSSSVVNANTQISYDELTQFEEEQYDQICARLRSSDPVFKNPANHLLKIRSCSNPVTKQPKGETITLKNPFWVRDRFIEPDRNGNVIHEREFTRKDGRKVIKTWMYLPAKLSDNPDKEFAEQYEATLLNLPERLRKPYLDGDWYYIGGAHYADEWNPTIHICKPFAIPGHWKRFRSMDWGFKKFGTIGWFAMDEDGNLFAEREYNFKGKLVEAVAADIKQIEKQLGIPWKNGRSQISGPADTQLWEQRGTAAKSMAQQFAEKGVLWSQADKKSRITNSQRFSARLLDHENGTTTPGIVFFDTCRQCIKTIPSIPSDKGNPESPSDGGEDHWHDMVLYACAYASHGKAGIAGKAPDDEDDEEFEEPGSRGRYGYGSSIM